MFAAAIVPSWEAVEQRMFDLTWRDQAGGPSFTRECVMAMDLDEMDRHLARVAARRKAYNKAVREANRPPTRKR